MFRIWESPISERPTPTDFNEVKRDLDKKHWCKSYHLTQSSMGARVFNLGDIGLNISKNLKINHHQIQQGCRCYFDTDVKDYKAWEPNSAATFCGQPHKQASAQGHNNIRNNKA